MLDAKEREVYAVAALAVGSGCLPNILGHYGGNVFGANLYLYVLGNYGEGKAGVMHARKLGEAIHLEKLEYSKELEKDYKREMAQYKKAFKLFEAGKAEMPDEPTPPEHRKFYLPANSSKTAVKQLLKENSGRGVIFETEGDTLADVFKQDYGNFSDDLRKAWGHEPLSYYRRTNNEDVDISFPCVSVVLSSTFDQLLRLIPNIENGLFSRFMYYELESSPEFKNVFDKKKVGYGKYFSELGLQYQNIYNELAKQEYPIYFELQPHQEAQFVKVFQDQKSEILEFVGSALGGTINRLGLICFRIAMQLAALRAFDDGELPNPLICSDQDFENAIRITECLKKHALSVFYKLPKPRVINPDAEEDKDVAKVENKKKCLELHSQGLSVREISEAVFGTEKKKSTVHRWINGN
ncbi:DUF3987 domain-containing protein [Adhaeribacter sp. BT258]|uniref:DUF3987 domain-containing protein n=1 Tax=Adhaeribacter terrigena TaxID=2793070 RepID=A0ABS1C5P9_9BACT|nr:DUF3987 domain-containing protein [Adhaeribacter terrigena]MBK0403880.1 DUF3987 domain-containing protein [Adhaeribacter terrigena]